jgi:predicted DCC family thiol-disulfide oxidoreductase YuxK
MDRPDSPSTCTAPDGLTVLYDGACPLCRREVGVYQGLAPTQPLEFRDISEPVR